jgi:8-oxo-dGTP pyrophosphatase MutT (NUDIX family)
LVEPGYKETWEIPGGVVDVGESPRRSCAREIHEELGLVRAPGRLLVLDFCRRPYVQWEGLRFVFDGGLLEPVDIAEIRLPKDELRSYRFVDRGELAKLAAPQLARRVSVALDTGPGETVYLEDGEDRAT